MLQSSGNLRLGVAGTGADTKAQPVRAALDERFEIRIVNVLQRTA
jgi:hypothetical protein